MMKKNEIKIGMQVIFDRAYVGATCGTVLAVEADRVKSVIIMVVKYIADLMMFTLTKRIMKKIL